jgi:hypothetical protein
MAGADESGEEMQSGRTNRAEDPTRVWAQQDEGEAFNGDVIFVVEGAGDIEDDDFSLPSSRLHAIRASGVMDGAGVVGLDGAHGDEDVSNLMNVGVFGRGDTGVRGEGGSDGPGVEGIGGNRPFFGIRGVGVLGRGGRQDDENNEERKPHGPGVIGMGGGRAKTLANDSIVDSVGVFGQGADAEERTVDGVVHGPSLAGAGVVGRGGVTNSTESQVGPGVVGWAGGSDNLPVLAFVGDIGVVGFGGTGVRGIGLGDSSLGGPGVQGEGSNGAGFAGSRGVIGPGVVGQGGRALLTGAPIFAHAAGVIGIAVDTPPSASETNETGVYGTGLDGVKGAGAEGRGGVFKSERSAQVQLIPAKRPVTKEQAATTPLAVANPGTLGPNLPKNGRGGDLMSVVDQDGECTLWFCIRDSTSGSPAHWAQVLLGPSFDGKA